MTLNQTKHAIFILTPIQFHFDIVFHVIVWIVDKGPSQAKITQLYVAVSVNKNVGWFDVPMHDVWRVQKINAAKKIVKQVLDMVFVKLSAILTRMLYQFL